MILPAMIYVTFLPRGTNIQGLGISAALAQAISGTAGALLGSGIAFLGAWVLFKTQLDQLEGMVRAITDMLWTGSSKVRGWRGGDVRAVYYGVLGGSSCCGASSRCASRSRSSCSRSAPTWRGWCWSSAPFTCST